METQEGHGSHKSQKKSVTKISFSTSSFLGYHLPQDFSDPLIFKFLWRREEEVSFAAPLLPLPLFTCSPTNWNNVHLLHRGVWNAIDHLNVGKILCIKNKNWNILIITCSWGGEMHHFQLLAPFYSTFLHVPLRCWKKWGLPFLVFLACKSVSFNFAALGRGNEPKLGTQKYKDGSLEQSHRPRTSRRLAVRVSFLREDVCR